MKRLTIFKAFAPVLLATATAKGEILPSFDHTQLATDADHVVLVTEGGSIDGNLTVLAAYKGDIPAGSDINIPSLRIFADRAKRTIQPLIGQPKPQQAEVSCRLMILFLDGEGDKLRPSSPDPDWHTWLCWIEEGIVYAKWQQVNPGKTSLKEYGRGLGATLATILKDTRETAQRDDVGGASPPEGTELARMVGKGREQLQKEHGPTLMALTGHREPGSLQPEPWHVWKFKTPDEKLRYVIFSGRNLVLIPGDSGASILLLDGDGTRIGSWNLMTGYRSDIMSAELAFNETVRAPTITITTQPVPGRVPPGRQFFAILDDRLYFMRHEDHEGKLAQNHYLSPNFTLGGDLPAKDLDGWTALLAAPELPKRLGALTYLGGIHMDPDKPREGVVSEPLEDAKLARAFRMADPTKKHVARYRLSDNAWLKEAADLAAAAMEENQ